jgi:hypothetical protein
MFESGGYFLKILLFMLRILLPCGLNSQSVMFEIGNVKWNVQQERVTWKALIIHQMY